MFGQMQSDDTLFAWAFIKQNFMVSLSIWLLSSLPEGLSEPESSQDVSDVSSVFPVGYFILMQVQVDSFID